MNLGPWWSVGRSVRAFSVRRSVGRSFGRSLGRTKEMSTRHDVNAFSNVALSELYKTLAQQSHGMGNRVRFQWLSFRTLKRKLHLSTEM